MTNETTTAVVVNGRLQSAREGGWTVEAHVVSPIVDRPHTFGITVRSAKLAQWIVKAFDSGRAFGPAEIKTDVNGKTYVGHACKILGRTANADLKRLGF